MPQPPGRYVPLSRRVVRDEGRFNSQLPDYSWITDNSEGIHLDEKLPIRRSATLTPRKSGSGQLRYSGAHAAAHLREAGFLPTPGSLTLRLGSSWRMARLSRSNRLVRFSAGCRVDASRAETGIWFNLALLRSDLRIDFRSLRPHSKRPAGPDVILLCDVCTGRCAA